MKVKIFLLIVFIIACASEEAPDMTNNQKLLDTITAIAGTVGSPEMKATVAVLNSMRTETSRTIGQVQKQAGYNSLHISGSKKTGAVKVHNLERLMKILLSGNEYSALGQEYKDIFAQAIERAMIDEDEHGLQDHVFRIAFTNGIGQIVIVVLALHPTSKPDVVDYMQFVSKMAFEIAPDFVIVTNSDCSFLSCDRTDEIVYLKANLKPEDINALLNVNLNFISAFSYGGQLTLASQNHPQLGNRDLSIS